MLSCLRGMVSLLSERGGGERLLRLIDLLAKLFASPSDCVEHAGQHCACEIVQQVLLRVEGVVGIQLKHSSLRPHGERGDPFDKFMHAADAKREQRDGKPEPPTRERMEATQGAVENETGDEAEVEVYENIELDAEEFPPIKSEGAEIMQEQRDGKESKVKRVEGNFAAEKIDEPKNWRQDGERKLVGAAGRRGPCAQRDHYRCCYPPDNDQGRFALWFAMYFDSDSLQEAKRGLNGVLAYWGAQIE